MTKQKIEIFETSEGQAHIKVRFEHETIWLSQAQMADLFDKDVRTINEHIKNIFKSQELIENEATIRNFRIVRQEGTRQVRKTIKFYNLDGPLNTPNRVVLGLDPGTHLKQNTNTKNTVCRIQTRSKRNHYPFNHEYAGQKG